MTEVEFTVRRLRRLAKGMRVNPSPRALAVAANDYGYLDYKRGLCVIQLFPADVSGAEVLAIVRKLIRHASGMTPERVQRQWRGDLSGRLRMGGHFKEWRPVW